MFLEWLSMLTLICVIYVLEAALLLKVSASYTTQKDNV